MRPSNRSSTSVSKSKICSSPLSLYHASSIKRLSSMYTNQMRPLLAIIGHDLKPSKSKQHIKLTVIQKSHCPEIRRAEKLGSYCRTRSSYAKRPQFSAISYCLSAYRALIRARSPRNFQHSSNAIKSSGEKRVNGENAYFLTNNG